MSESTTRFILPNSLETLIARINALRAQLYSYVLSSEDRARMVELLGLLRVRLAERLAGQD